MGKGEDVKGALRSDDEKSAPRASWRPWFPSLAWAPGCPSAAASPFGLVRFGRSGSKWILCCGAQGCQRLTSA